MAIRRNYIFSALLTISNYIFSFIAYPYVARVLGVNNIGICNFVDSLVGYASVVSLMGITIIGTREIAKAAGNRERLDRVFTALMVLTLATTVIATIALVVATYTVSALIPYRKLLLISLIKLWGTVLLLDWFFRGLEEFRYITLRSVAVKLLFLITVFLTIRSQGDYTLYFALTCITIAVNAIVNCARASRIVKLRFDSRLIRSFATPYLLLGLYMVLIAMYWQLNTVALGLTHGDTDVGCYSTAVKVFEMLIALYTACSLVILPRASALLGGGDDASFHRLIGKSVSALLLYAIPMGLYVIMFADGIVALIAGPGYEGAVLPLRILMASLIVCGYEQIMVNQTLMPMGCDRAVIRSAACGAVAGLALNLILPKAYGPGGAAVVWLIAEAIVMVVAFRYATKKIELRFPWHQLGRNLLAWLPYVAIAYSLIAWSRLSAIACCLAGIPLTCIYFIFIQRYILHNDIYSDAVGALRARIATANSQKQ